tara:strand:+ start:30 stop:305 length:276 start_codon:yes stop_codon:yes gene_type:complete
MKRIAKKNVSISLKGGRDNFKTIKLVEGKPVVESKLLEMSRRQINEYTEEVYEGADLSFLTPEDKKYYNKNKKHPDMQWALDMVYEDRTTN